jgi:hypothetical protein
MTLTLKGPNKFVKKTGVIKEIKNTNIESGTFKWKGKKYNLLENHITFNLDNDGKKILIYHMFYYLNEKGIKDSGRWYKWFNKIAIKDNTLVHTVEEYEDFDETKKYSVSPATISITFNDKAVEKIQKLFNKLE